MTLVSVIIPTHDRAGFLGGAIETVLNQTHAECEVLVVNDGSTDGTEAVLDRYAARDDRVRAFHRPTNRGIADGRNYALAHARGEFVCPLDDDDRWHPAKIERQLAAFDRCSDAVGVVYSGGLVRRGEELIGAYRPRDDRRGDIYPAILVEFGLQPYAGHMIRKECFDRVGGYDPALGCGEDWDHSIRLAQAYEFAAVSDPLVERLFHGDNASQERERTHGSSVDIPRRIEEGTGPYGRIWDKYRADIEAHPDLERRFRARRELACARVELDGGDRAKALDHGRRALARDPSIDAALVSVFACLGPGALDAARRLRNAWADRRLSELREAFRPRIDDPEAVAGTDRTDRTGSPGELPVDAPLAYPNTGSSASRRREVEEL